TGITVTPALAADHVDGAPLSAGVANTRGLIPDGPQGGHVMVANIDQKGIQYRARHLGNEHYHHNIARGGGRPRFTTIDASRSSTTTPAAPTRCRSSATGAFPGTASSAPSTRAPIHRSAATRTRTRPGTRASRRSTSTRFTTPTTTRPSTSTTTPRVPRTGRA